MSLPEPIVDRVDGWTRSTRPSWPTPSDWPCSSCWRRCRRPSGSRSCSTTCSACPSTRSARSWTARRRQRASSRAVPPPRARRARGARRRSRRPARGRGCVPRRGARGDFDRPLPCSTRTRPPERLRRAAGARVVRGAEAVARQAPRSQLGLDIRPALVNGIAGAVSFRDGRPFAVGAVTGAGWRIVELDILADPERSGCSTRSSTADGRLLPPGRASARISSRPPSPMPREDFAAVDPELPIGESRWPGACAATMAINIALRVWPRTTRRFVSRGSSPRSRASCSPSSCSGRRRSGGPALGASSRRDIRRHPRPRGALGDRASDL